MRCCRIFFSLLLVFTSLSIISATAAERYQQMVITQHGGPEVLRWVSKKGLPQPGPGEVRLKVLRASASFTDIMVRKGSYQGIDAELPYPPGYDLVGMVDALGDGVSGLELGQRVADLTVWGAYSEYVTRPAAGVVAVPDAISSEQAVVLILSYVTAYQMLYRVAEVKPEQRVLIHGASGAVGTALAQLGRMSGLEMWGTASTAKQDYVRALGVQPIDYKTEDFVKRINADTDGKGVDLVLDAIGPDNFMRSYSVLAEDGLLLEYGLYNASLRGDQLDVLLDVAQWQWQELMWRWFPEQERRTTFYSIGDLRTEQPEWFKQDLAALFELSLEGSVEPHIHDVMHLEHAAAAHRAIENGDVRGKIVLHVSD